MGTQHRSRTLSAALILAALAALAGAETSPPASADSSIDPELLRVREAAWRSWFAGDEAALGAMLPPEFIGLDMEGGPFVARNETLAASRAFRAQGGKLIRLEFPETRAQRYGDVVVLYGRYSVALAAADGSETTYAGRLTEVFVLRAGRWWHPGWHLDVSPAP